MNKYNMFFKYNFYHHILRIRQDCHLTLSIWFITISVKLLKVFFHGISQTHTIQSKKSRVTPSWQKNVGFEKLEKNAWRIKSIWDDLLKNILTLHSCAVYKRVVARAFSYPRTSRIMMELREKSCGAKQLLVREQSFLDYVRVLLPFIDIRLVYCLVLLQVPKQFVLVRNFCVRPKIDLYIVLVPQFFLPDQKMICI